VRWGRPSWRAAGVLEPPSAAALDFGPYLTRSVSALYALHGALLIFLSLDVRRYLPLVRFLGAASIVMGVLLLGLDLAVGMPVFWTVAEGPPVVALGLVILVSVRRVKAWTPTAPTE
jgi:hypothetical protein